MFYWDSTPKDFSVGNKIKFTPDPFNPNDNSKNGVIEEVYSDRYVVKWDDGVTESVGKIELHAVCDLILEPSVGCWHNWVKYKGFTREYEYCSKCDAKKE